MDDNSTEDTKATTPEPKDSELDQWWANYVWPLTPPTREKSNLMEQSNG